MFFYLPIYEEEIGWCEARFRRGYSPVILRYCDGPAP